MDQGYLLVRYFMHRFQVQLHVHNQSCKWIPPPTINLSKGFSFSVQARAAMDPCLMVSVFRVSEFFQNVFVSQEENCVHMRGQQARYLPKSKCRKNRGAALIELTGG